MNIQLAVADSNYYSYAEETCRLMEIAADKRGTGIAKRESEYIIAKMKEGKAIIAIDLDHHQLAGFCYIESWDDEKYIANSGLIVHPNYRNMGIGRQLKGRIFELSRTKYPHAKIFGITTSMAVMKINSDMGYKPVTFSELTQDKKFWDGCKSCPNYDILNSKNRKACLCTGMLYEPEKEEKMHGKQPKTEQKEKRWEKFKRFLRQHTQAIEHKTKSIFNT